MRCKREMPYPFFFSSALISPFISTTEIRKSRQINKVNDNKLFIIRFYTVVCNSPYSTNLVQSYMYI